MQNTGSPVEASPSGAAPGRGRRQDRVVALLEKLDEAFMDGRDPRESALIINRAHVAPALELRTQLLRETIASFLPLSLKIRRHFGFHDRAVQLPRVDRRWQELDLFDLLAQLLDQLGKPLLGVFVRALPVGRLHEREHRRQRRLFRRHLDKRDARARPRIGVSLIVADELLGEERDVFNTCARIARRGRACARV